MGEKLWGGRFKKKLDKEIFEFTKSISFDKRLAFYDIEGSIAHAKMLGKSGIISQKEKELLVEGLKEVKKEILKIKFENEEDIHTLVINLLRKRVGDVADKLHIGRSRNDQVVLDLRLYCRNEVKEIIGRIRKLQISLLERAKKLKALTIPFYTHLKNAQCIIFAHQFLAYLQMLERDKERLKESLERIDIMPLGSGAGRGSTLPLDRFFLAKELGFSCVSENSLDAVSDRDFVIEVLSNLSILGMHLSRICEDLILFSSDEIGFIEGDDAHFTGSSILPHKKNPDPLELIRGYSGKIYGDLISVLVTMKGLPLSYNRDMQLDKPPLFDSVEIIKKSISVLGKIISKIKVNEERLKKASAKEFLFSTDLAEFLVTKGYSWQKAHTLVGKLILESEEKKKPIREMSDKHLKKIIPELNKEIISELLEPLKSVRRIKTYGGSSPAEVTRQLAIWERRLKRD